ncbi:MAG: hypothetical protein V1929_10335 [bacterium]
MTNPTPSSSDWFGYSVAGMGTNGIIVGASEDDLGAVNAGTVYLFDTNGALLTTIANPAPASQDIFGWTVAALGPNRIVVGAYGDDQGGEGAGTVYLFSSNGVLLTTFTNPAPQLNDYFGYRVATLGSDRIVIAAAMDDAAGEESGTIYVYDTNGTELAEIANPAPAAFEYFGYAIAAAPNFILAGAYLDDVGQEDSGSAYLFDLSKAGRRIENVTRASRIEVDPVSSNNLATAYMWVGASGDVAVTKSQTLPAAATGQTNIYTIVASNAGATVMTGLRIQERIPTSGIQLLSTNLTTGYYDNKWNAWEITALAPGESQTLTLTFRVTATNAVLTNSAILVYAGMADVNPDNDTASVLTVVNPTPPPPPMWS